MDFKPEHYFRTALERMEQTRHLYGTGTSFALAIYVAGLAVECLLRAFKLRRDPAFDERHDLLRLFRASGLLNVSESQMQGKGLSGSQVAEYANDMQGSLNVVVALWSNSFRFASENHLRSYLKKTTGFEKIKGDYLKAIAFRVINAAQRFTDRGVLLWPLFAN